MEADGKSPRKVTHSRLWSSEMSSLLNPRTADTPCTKASMLISEIFVTFIFNIIQYFEIRKIIIKTNKDLNRHLREVNACMCYARNNTCISTCHFLADILEYILEYILVFVLDKFFLANTHTRIILAEFFLVILVIVLVFGL